MSNWGKKLTAKLTVLNEASSKESVQTLAKWIGFNRKHVAAGFVPALKDALSKASSPALQLNLLSVIHEVLVLDKDTPDKWDRMEELRVTLAENVLLPTVNELQEPSREKLRTTFIKEWDDSNSLGGPTMINMLRKAVSTKSAETKAATASPTSDKKDTSTPPQEDSPTKESNDTKQTTKEESKQSIDELLQDEKDDVPVDTNRDDSPGKVAKSSEQSSSASTAGKTYDFEATGIAAEKVETKTLLEPTQAIASLQIARDLRNDSAVQLSSLLATLPDNIKQSVEEKEELSSDKIKDYLARTPDALLDMDLDEQLQSIRMYRDIIKRQRASRKELRKSLIQSRCNFGAEEVADAFDNADRARDQLLKRKQILMDAMELEGLDVAEDEKNLHSNDAEEFPKLEWHKKAKAKE